MVFLEQFFSFHFHCKYFKLWSLIYCRECVKWHAVCYATSVCTHHISLSSSKINSIFLIRLTDRNLPLLFKSMILLNVQLQVSVFSLPLYWWKVFSVILHIQATYSDYRGDHVLIITLYASLYIWEWEYFLREYIKVICLTIFAFIVDWTAYSFHCILKALVWSRHPPAPNTVLRLAIADVDQHLWLRNGSLEIFEAGG